MMKIYAVASALTIALALAQTQTPTPPTGQPPDPQTMIAMRVAMLTAQLSLTDAQKASATQIYTDAYTASQSVRTDLSTNRQDLATAVKGNNTANIETLAATAGTLNGKLIAINSKADAALYALLTPDQQTKYASMPGPGHPGGPGRPGGFGRPFPQF